MLVVFGGLPGTGKTTISRLLAARRRATYLRIDVIEQSLRSAKVLAGSVGAAGYVIGNAVAEANLACGQTVIVDCVNPVPESRLGWQMTASRSGARLVDIEVVCSDLAEHRRRVKERSPDIDGLILPDWQAVLDRHYVPWSSPRLTIDTAQLDPDKAVAIIDERLEVR